MDLHSATRINPNQSIFRAIEGQIDELATAFTEAPGIILTEDDLKCILHSRLSSLPHLTGTFETSNPNIRATKVHSEVSWFDPDNKLTIKPDLTILDPQQLLILSGNARRARLPSKGFRFNGDSIIFELKFMRQQSGITNSLFHREIKRDWDKIQRLFNRLADQGVSDSIFCYFVIFSKSDVACTDFVQFLRENSIGENHKIIYRSGGVF